MAKIQIDEKKIEEVLSRGVEKIYPNKETLKKQLMSGKRIRLYCGFDPSALSLHIGNAVLINKLSQFQELGHEVIFLIGDFTGMIGDPTDKETTRKKMTRKQVLMNAKDYKKQASAYLRFSGNNAAKVMYNSKWSDKMSFKDLIEVSSNFTVQQMIQRDMFKRNLTVVKCRHCNFEWKSPIQLNNLDTVTLEGNKINCPNCGKMTSLNKEDIILKKVEQIRETPIGFHELLYPVAQGYDSVAMDVDLEVGGNDQMFNMLAGRILQKAINNKEKFVLTMKLLADDKGKKMGKSEGNAVFLNEEPNNMYGIIMSWSDGFIIPAFELATKLPMKEVGEMRKQLDSGVNPRNLKMKLAYEIVRICHGEKAAEGAENDFVGKFQRKDLDISAYEDIRISGNVEINKKTNIVNILITDKRLAVSKGEARRLMGQGAIKVNGEVVKDINTTFEITEKGLMIQRGKKVFIRIKI